MDNQLPITNVFIESQNKYFKVYSGGKVTAKECFAILRAHCEELSILARDERFFEFIGQLSEKAQNKETREEAYRMLGDFTELSKFLYFEEKFLKQIGVSDAYSHYLVSTMNNLQHALSQPIDGLADPDYLKQKFFNLAAVSCAAAEEAKERDWLFYRAALGRRMLRFGGALTIAANGLALGLVTGGGVVIYLASCAAGIALTEIGGSDEG
jgi:hypothetical protein